MTDGATQRFFISYAGVDRPWAEWIGWYLKEAGHEVVLDVWDWRTGDDFVERMEQALAGAEAVVALLSRSYFDPERWTKAEKNATLARGGRLIPLVVEPLSPADVPPLLAPLIRKEIHGLEEAAALKALREAIDGGGLPDTPPAFPGNSGATGQLPPEDDTKPRLPGDTAPEELVSNIGRRNPDFSGREADLARIRDDLLSGRQAVVRALHGLGGIGKTQIALEYAHRFAGQYDLVWWIDAEQADQIPVHYTELADRLGLAKPDAGSKHNALALLADLRTRRRWLIVLDNAEDPEQIKPWLPEGAGHVLITSRNPDWRGVARQTELSVFDRPDSVSYLRSQIPSLTVEDAELLATALGDLPLAMAQTAGVVGSGMTIERYRELLATNAEQILQVDRAPDYPASLAAAVGISAGRLENDYPDAAAVLRLAAFFGPDPIPTRWLEKAQGRLHTIPGDPDDVMWTRNALRPLSRFGLARVDHENFQIHRLTQAVLRDRLGEREAEEIRNDAATVLAEAVPGDPEAPETWPAWAPSASHLVAAYIDRTEPPQLRPALLDAALFLIVSGQARSAWRLSTALSELWVRSLGEDHPDTLRCMQYLGRAMCESGDVNEALIVIQDTLARRRRAFGDDHPDTLESANDMAATLIELQRYSEAHVVIEDAYQRRRRVLGEKHPHTLQTASNLATTLWQLDKNKKSRIMFEEIFEHQRRTLGDDHRDTLYAAHGVATNLIGLGEPRQARQMLEDVLRRQQQSLGDNHRETLATARQLAHVLDVLGEHEESRVLYEDILRRTRQSVGNTNPHTLTTAHGLALCLFHLRRFAEAAELLDEVRKDARRVLGDEAQLTAVAGRNLAKALIALGRPFEAQRILSTQRKRAKPSRKKKKRR